MSELRATGRRITIGQKIVKICGPVAGWGLVVCEPTSNGTWCLYNDKTRTLIAAYGNCPHRGARGKPCASWARREAK